MLLLEGDSLTRWSISKYLDRWFVLDAVENGSDAARRAARTRYAALILSDELAPKDAAQVLAAAARRNPEVAVIRTITATREGEPPNPPRAVQLEKPFQLASLARLLGVSPTELPAAAE